MTVRVQRDTGVVKVTGGQGTARVVRAGPQGPPGQGVPTGGSTGQVLTKTSNADYATAWQAPSSGGGSLIPTTGTTVVGHRCGSAYHAENTLDALRVCAAYRIPPETDVMLSSDGIPMLIHDTTVDRTTASSGNVNAFTSQALLSMVVDCSSWMGAGYPNTTIPTFADFLGRCKDLSLLGVPEFHDATSGVPAFVNMIKGFGVENQMLCQATVRATADAILAAGLQVFWIVDSDIDLNAYKAAGYTWIGHSYLAAGGAARVAASVAAGLHVVTYTPRNRFEYQTQAAANPRIIMAEDPVYVSSTTRLSSSVDWSQNKWHFGAYYGVNASNVVSVTGGRLVIGGTPSEPSCVIGQIGPVNDEEQVVVTGRLTSGAPWMGISIWPDDRGHKYTGSKGFLGIVRLTGVVDCYKLTGSTSNASGTGTGVAYTVGSDITITLKRKGGSVSISQSGGTTPATVAYDAAGGWTGPWHVSLVRGGTSGAFEVLNVSVGVAT